MANKKKEEHHGFIDRMLHGDHGHASESEEAAVSQDIPEQKKPKKKNSVEGASSESKHHQKKFDKFKKGNG